jgi:hypothetical protein
VCLRDDVHDVIATEAKLPPVAERRNELPVAVQEPLRVDRGQVSDPALVVEPDSVALRRFLGWRSLIVAGSREVEHVTHGLVRSVELKVYCSHMHVAIAIERRGW